MWEPKWRVEFRDEKGITELIETNTEPHNLLRQKRIQQRVQLSTEIAIIKLK